MVTIQSKFKRNYSLLLNDTRTTVILFNISRLNSNPQHSERRKKMMQRSKQTFRIGLRGVAIVIESRERHNK